MLGMPVRRRAAERGTDAGDRAITKRRCRVKVNYLPYDRQFRPVRKCGKLREFSGPDGLSPSAT
jgi:hypothetical protein